MTEKDHMGLKKVYKDENSREWDEKHKMAVNTVYGFFVGTAIIGISFWQIFPHLSMDGNLSRDEMIFIVILIVIGVTASMPHIFKQILSAFLRRRNGRNGGAE